MKPAATRPPICCGQLWLLLDRPIAVDATALGAGQVEGGEGDAVRTMNSARVQRLGVEDVQVQVR